MSVKSQVIKRIQPADRICFISFKRLLKKDTIAIHSKNSPDGKVILVSRKVMEPYIKEIKKKLQPLQIEKLQKLIGTDKTKGIKVLSLNGTFSIVENQLKKAKYPTIMDGIQRMVSELVGKEHA